MSKIDRNKETIVEETISSTENFFTKNKNILMYGTLGVVALVAIYFAYGHFISRPKAEQALVQISKAEELFAQDSFRLALVGDGNNLGFEGIIKEYGSTPSGHLALFYAGICNMHLGNYEQAIVDLKKFSPNDEVLGARALSNIGDCYVELGQEEEGLKYFIKAANKRENAFSAGYLMKAAAVYENMNNYQEALKLYEIISMKYNDSPDAQDINKYIARARVFIDQKSK